MDKEAGSKLRASFETKLNIEIKTNPNDLVTNMDKAIETFFCDKITETFPEHRIFGEEGMGNEIKDLKGTVWILDPIDGTLNFIHQQRNFAISLGIYEDGIGKIGMVYDVVNDELYHVIKGEGAFMNDQRLSPLKEVSVSKAILSMNASWVTENRRIDPSLLAPLVRDVARDPFIWLSSIGVSIRGCRQARCLYNYAAYALGLCRWSFTG